MYLEMVNNVIYSNITFCRQEDKLCDTQQGIYIWRNRV